MKLIIIDIYVQINDVNKAYLVQQSHFWHIFWRPIKFYKSFFVQIIVFYKLFVNQKVKWIKTVSVTQPDSLSNQSKVAQ